VVTNKVAGRENLFNVERIQMAEEPVSRWEVNGMIDAKIEKYDVKQDQRQRETSAKLDRNEDAVSKLKDSLTSEFKEIRQTLADQKDTLAATNAASDGISQYKQWIIPTLLTVGLVVVGILDLLKHQ
jgi:ribosomal protein L10